MSFVCMPLLNAPSSPSATRKASRMGNEPLGPLSRRAAASATRRVAEEPGLAPRRRGCSTARETVRCADARCSNPKLGARTSLTLPPLPQLGA